MQISNLAVFETIVLDYSSEMCTVLNTDPSSLRAPDITIAGHVSASICSCREPDIDLQLHAGSTYYVEDDLAARGRFQSGLSSGRSPAQVLTAG